MKVGPAVAALLSFVLVVETAHVARAEPVEPVVVTTEPSFFVVPPPELASRLALTAPLTDDVRALAPASAKPVMSSNAKTVLIVAIIAGAVLLAVGVIAIGKPFGHH